ncbi:superfamily II helicase [Peribacillus asahii]|uniref:Superfamily II helicase n=1 Tax=Peribacillus asahii TaxID=228899 RepID=A0A3T0KX20_9BACI|nr:DEAD/DEAH box helicase [Peribacillus asahii]AZV44843.1 superfamily II helicase [Peribacillus asahii]
MERKPRFIVPKPRNTAEKDPESIFRELQIPSVKGLWSQQADILRDYYNNYKDKPNIAIELPTGTGKTLVGLLIAEYRRRCKGERVLYLCPTRQLAYQVSEKSQEYGIKTSILVGPQANYSEKDYGDYVTGKSIAITTYSGLFNTNPKLNDAHTIIFDDAHSAENYISSLWTFAVTRKDNPDEFNSIIELYKDDISEYSYSRIMRDDYEYKKPIYDLVPYPKYLEKLPQLVEYIDSKISTLPNNAKFPWSMIRDNLEACQLFFSWGEINIRPLSPPTLTHRPFANAKQRIFMSATLGEGGELERITGIKKINKIPIPKGWDKYSNGRRLILFPNRKFSQKESLDLTFKAINNHGRALVLCPDNRTSSYFKKQFIEEYPQIPIIEATDIEENLNAFINKERAVLLLTSRYDGIDLSEDSCRLLVLYGMPEATNLQEGFLWNSLNANVLLKELVKTRITQALGRCTRSSDDFANVLMVDPTLLKFCANSENLNGFHPEIQAEIDFGLQNSENFESIDEIIEFMDYFIGDKTFFSEINSAITSIREDYEKQVQKATSKLTESVKYEIEYVYGMWKNDLEWSLEKVKSVLDTATGGKELDGYRAWWYYLAGNTAYLAKDTIQSASKLSSEYYSSALRITYGISWLAELVNHLALEKKDEVQVDPYLTIQAENIEDIISSLGLMGGKFEKNVNEFFGLINTDESEKFEKGLKKLGEFLGFETDRPNGDGAPDGIWILRDLICGFEAKSDEDKEHSISISTCRQALGHKDWIREKKALPEGQEINVTVLSHKSKVHTEAVPHAKHIFHLEVEEIRELSLRITQVLRKTRSVISKDSGNTLFTKEYICKILEQENLTYRDILELLKRKRVSDMEKGK